MDDNLKDILARHWSVLVRYINPTDTLINTLETGHVLPATMVDDVRKAGSKKQKNEKMLHAIKLRGNVSFWKFRDAMMKCGQVFLADLLYEEDKKHAPLVEESDFVALKINIDPDELKRVAAAIDAKVKYRILKSDWKSNSSGKLDALQKQTDTHVKCREKQSHIRNQTKSVVRELEEDVSSKNDLLSSISREVNFLNKEMNDFLKRHKVGSSVHVTTCVTHGSGIEGEDTTEVKKGDGKGHGRFQQFEQNLSGVTHRLMSLLGESFCQGHGTTLSDVDLKARQVQELVRDLEAKLDNVIRERDQVVELLCPGKKIVGVNPMQDVQQYIQAEQKDKANLLKGIDCLSRKLRGMNIIDPNSGLHGLRQSAVTGKPTPEMINYRFLKNHLSLVEADAEHIAKRLDWKDVEIKALRGEVTQLRRRFMNRKFSPAFQPLEVELGD